jgi:hypothetical protein
MKDQKSDEFREFMLKLLWDRSAKVYGLFTASPAIGSDVKDGDRWSELMQQAASLGCCLEECMGVD